MQTQTFIAAGAPQYKANLHSHTNLSDGCLTPKQMRDAYRAHGYSILCISDHEYPKSHADLDLPDFLMLSGYEAYIRGNEDCVSRPFEPEIHINLFAKKQNVTPYIGFVDKCCKYAKDPAVRAAFIKVGPTDRAYTVDYINRFVAAANEAGYLCALNHPVWSLETYEQISQYRGFFSMEMCNFGAYRELNEYNGALYERLCREGHRIYCHSADDNHNPVPLDDPSSDSFGGFTMILAKELTYDAVIKALENGDFYSSMGPEIKALTIDGNRVHVECSPAQKVSVTWGDRNTRTTFGSQEQPVTVVDVTLPDGVPFFRVQVKDFEGAYADTRAYHTDEL